MILDFSLGLSAAVGEVRGRCKWHVDPNPPASFDFMTVSKLVEKYLDITEEIRDLRMEREGIVVALNARLGGGKWRHRGRAATPYWVRETEVRSHMRRGYSAVRVSQVLRD